jgi:hypothetical protein
LARNLESANLEKLKLGKFIEIIHRDEPSQLVLRIMVVEKLKTVVV